ncbi:MAG: hypothetical protein PHS14_14250 [Elusimicrobia bacterium]|nr:hypothetical protein [Elusimicrobiota bacterium]
MTKTEIVNAALALLGTEERIVDLDSDDTAEAQSARDVYAMTYEAALAEYRWSFARVESSQLALLVDLTAEGQQQYALPGDFLAVTKVFGESSEKYAFRIDGRNLVILDAIDEETPVFLGYIRRVDEGSLPPPVARALSRSLAAELAVPLTASTTLADYWSKAAEEAWSQARRADLQSAGTMRLGRDSEFSMLTARRG